jgi:hypothetical protein
LPAFFISINNDRNESFQKQSKSYSFLLKISNLSASKLSDMRTILLFCFLFLWNNLLAQSKNFTGFYISNDGDTIKGSFPKYSQWNYNPDIVEFLPADSKPIRLTPSNCKKISIENYDEYISYSGKRLTNPIEDNEAIDSRGYFDYKDKDTSINSFLRLVAATPKCGIYVYTDKIRTNFFYKLPGESIQELRFKKYYDENNIHEVAEYRQQLNNLFPEDISNRNLTKSLEELSYTEDAMEHFLLMLFPGKASTEYLQRGGVNWIIAAGASINFMKVNGSFLASGEQTDYTTSVSPFLSIGYLVPIRRKFNRYFLYPQLRLYNYQNTGEYPNGSFIRKVSFKSDLVIYPQLNFGANILNQQNSKLFLYGGAGMLFLAKNMERNQNIVPADGSVYNSGEIKTARLTYDLNVSTGFSVNQFLVLASYNFPVDIGNFQLYSPMHSNLQIGIGYKL